MWVTGVPRGKGTRDAWDQEHRYRVWHGKYSEVEKSVLWKLIYFQSPVLKKNGGNIMPMWRVGVQRYIKGVCGKSSLENETGKSGPIRALVKGCIKFDRSSDERATTSFLSLCVRK